MSENIQDKKLEDLQRHVEELTKMLEQERKNHEELKNKFLYLSADFDNFIKRVEKERESMILKERERVLTKFLPIVDDLEILMSIVKEDSLKEGVKMIRDKLYNLLKEEGFETIEAIGKPFDARYHEVLEGGEGVVVQELRKGFTFMGKVIRPSMVKLEKGGRNE
ncbi:Protein GrpE [archaeon HR06]|nr:Protein GrpE [archaeon HR06]